MYETHFAPRSLVCPEGKHRPANFFVTFPCRVGLPAHRDPGYPCLRPGFVPRGNIAGSVGLKAHPTRSTKAFQRKAHHHSPLNIQHYSLHCAKRNDHPPVADHIETIPSISAVAIYPTIPPITRVMTGPMAPFSVAILISVSSS
mgnify:CR=1 FL=1